MPVSIHAHTSLENLEIERQLQRLYAMSTEFKQGDDAITELKMTLGQGTTLYTAEFNTKVIAAMWVSVLDNHILFHHIVVHTANRGRGIAARLIEAVYELENLTTPNQITTNCPTIAHCLKNIKEKS